MKNFKNAKFVIEKSTNVGGEIVVKGAKNHALKVLAASVLTENEVKISNVPLIEDVCRKEELLLSLGVEVKREKETVTLNAKKIKTTVLDPEKSRTIRTSIVLAAALLSRFGKVTFCYPGGCVLGKRPIDIFLEGFRELGVEVTESGEEIRLKAKGGLVRGGEFFFPKISVTATEALILASVLAKGKTVLKNCALEPEIVSLCEFLNSCGAKIKGFGTPKIEITGVKKIKGGKCRIIPDRIEAATFLILGALHKTKLKVLNCDPKTIEALIESLKKAGVKMEIGKNFVTSLPYKELSGVGVMTHEYPGFATDYQPPYTVLMTQAQGVSLIHEPIFDGRLFFTDNLSQMGAKIVMCDPHRVVINGPTRLFGKNLASPDIRAGIALVLAGSIAEGKTVIDNIYQIDRGYQSIDERLKSVGVKIERI